VRGAFGERGAEQRLRFVLLWEGLEGVHGSGRRRLVGAAWRPR
jgi:hypothetical protein